LLRDHPHQQSLLALLSIPYEQVLDALMATRHKLALALGFESYAHRAFTDKMMRSPDEASHL
jgi:Zn-dependent oligopeptidase